MQDSPSAPVEAQPVYEGRSSRFSPFNFLFGFGFGAFVGVGLALLAIAMVDENQPAATATVGPEEPVIVAGTAEPTPDLRSRARAAQDVRLGPGTNFAIVGLLARGDAVELVGRDNDSEWLAIRFPPGSAGRGWIPVSAVDPAPDLQGLVVALPTPLPRTVSTFAPSIFGGATNGGATNGGATNGAGDDGGRTPVPGLPTRTPTPNPGPPDLVVSAVRLLSDGRVSATIANRGPGDVIGFTIFVQVRNLTNRSEMLTAPVQGLRAGQTTTVQTSSFVISGEETVQAIVDPLGGLPELDRSNNLTQVVLTLPPTVTPTVSDPAQLPPS